MKNQLYKKRNHYGTFSGRKPSHFHSTKVKQHAFASFVIFISSLMLLSSCKKFVQVDPPITQLVTASVFSNNSSATSAQLAIYTTMVKNQESWYMSQDNGLLSDELTSYSTNASEVLLYKNSLNSITPIGLNPWSQPYNYIYQANAVIEGLNNYQGVSPAVKQQLTGESKFVRAFWLFYLSNLFGDVPIVTTTDYNTNSKIARSPRVQVLQQVTADLKDAQSLLGSSYIDGSDTITTTERVRPNKAVATALLARVYLYLGDYAKDMAQYINAETQATSVINNSLYSLSPLTGANSVFMKNSSETILALYTPLPVASGATADGQSYILTAVPSTNVANSTAISTQLLNSFELGDNRKSSWIGSFTTTKAPIVTYNFPYKYKSTSATNGASVTEYVIVLRLAEQYLIRAEARAQQGNISGALSDLNVIRNRAGLVNYVGLTDKASLLTAILHERQVELFTEWGHRWFDLARTGNINSVMGSPGNVCQTKGGTWNSDGHQQLYPIPLNGNITYNPNLTQNPGY